MKTKFYLLFFFLLLLTSKTTQASHAAGFDISYACTSTPGIYKVTMKAYMDCSGIPLCMGCTQPIPTGNFSSCSTTNSGLPLYVNGADASCLGVSFGNFGLNAKTGQSVYDIVQTCSSTKTICTNCNTRTAGTAAPGIEVYIFEGDVDLRSVPATCCKVILSTSTCCRSNNISISSPDNFYAECTINRCQTPCNSAPVFTNNAIALACQGVDFIYNLGAIDPDGDSLSYAFGTSLQGPNTPISYNSPYSGEYPFAYLGAPNTNAAYPAGLRIDPVTGDVLFRPAGTWVAALVIEVTQWSKVGNTYVNVGVTRRDVQFQSINCFNNLAPKIKIYRNGSLQTTQNFSVNALQQICLDIVAEDQQNTAFLSDSTDITWNSPGQYIPVMANATWASNYVLAQRSINGPKADSFKFCWTPPVSAQRSLPYLFTVHGRDRNCPLPANVVKGITITVDEPNNLNISNSNKRIYCNSKTTTTSINYTANNAIVSAGNIFTIELSNASGSFTSPSVVGSKTTTALSGSVDITIPAGSSATGNYSLRLKASTDNNSISIPFPVIMVPGFSQPILSSNKDSLCQGNSAILSITPNTAGLNFKWILNNNAINSFNNDSLLIDTTGNIKVIVSNDGCSDTSNVRSITVFPKPVVSFTNPAYICAPNTIVSFYNTSTISSGTLSYLWLFSDSTSSTLPSPAKNITSTANLQVNLTATSDHNCAASLVKTIPVHTIIKPVFTISDSLQCFKNNHFTFTNQTNNQGATVNYTWNFGTGSNVASNVNIQSYQYANPGNYTVKLATNNNGCKDSITKPVTVLGNASNVNFSVNQNMEQCFKNNHFSFTNNSIPGNNTVQYFWDLGNGNTSTQISPSVSYTNSGTYTVTLVAIANNKCIDSSSQILKVFPNPVAGNITGNINASPGIATSYSVTAQNNITYHWGVFNGTIQSGQGSNAVSIMWSNPGTDTIWVVLDDSIGCQDTAFLNININHTGLQNINGQQALTIYPNPGKTVITISSQANKLAGKKYTISNTIGQMVLTGKLNAEETSVNIESLSNGVYLLRVEGISDQSFKIMKE